MRRALGIALAAVLSAGPAVAQPGYDLAVPQGAAISAERGSPATSMGFITGPWAQDAVPRKMLEGARTDTAWRLRANQATTLQLLVPLREQIVADGYAVLFECATDDCGGFDFRYAVDLLPEPEMHVDLGDFRYLAARRGDSYLGVMVSRSSESGFIHLTTMQAQEVALAQTSNDLLAAGGGGSALAPQSGTAVPPIGARPLSTQGLAGALEQFGPAPLDDLVFESGSATLGAGVFGSLASLADYLRANPQARVALVGHTDAEGSLSGNIALSKRRAEAVRARLLSDYDAPADQVTAEGAGWLAPRASNLTPEGREKNRRVEAVLTSTQR